MGMAVRMDVSRFKEQLQATADRLHKATRPAAQAGAQIVYERARINVPESVRKAIKARFIQEVNQ